MKFPMLIEWENESATLKYVVTAGSREGMVTLQNINTGHVWKNDRSIDSIQNMIDSGDITILASAIAKEKKATSVETLSLRIEADASPLSASLAQANKEANALLLTLSKIKSVFNTGDAHAEEHF